MALNRVDPLDCRMSRGGLIAILMGRTRSAKRRQHGLHRVASSRDRVIPIDGASRTSAYLDQCAPWSEEGSLLPAWTGDPPATTVAGDISRMTGVGDCHVVLARSIQAESVQARAQRLQVETFCDATPRHGTLGEFCTMPGEDNVGGLCRRACKSSSGSLREHRLQWALLSTNQRSVGGGHQESQQVDIASPADAVIHAAGRRDQSATARVWAALHTIVWDRAWLGHHPVLLQFHRRQPTMDRQIHRSDSHNSNLPLPFGRTSLIAECGYTTLEQIEYLPQYGGKLAGVPAPSPGRWVVDIFDQEAIG
jgi:hypothetical protein